MLLGSLLGQMVLRLNDAYLAPMLLLDVLHHGGVHSLLGDLEQLLGDLVGFLRSDLALEAHDLIVDALLLAQVLVPDANAHSNLEIAVDRVLLEVDDALVAVVEDNGVDAGLDVFVRAVKRLLVRALQVQLDDAYEVGLVVIILVPHNQDQALAQVARDLAVA